MSALALAQRASVARWLESPRARKWLLVGFIAFAFLLGGGSRFDIVSLVVLRPVAFLVIAYCLVLIRREEIATVKVPLVLLLCLAGLIALQLLPLPPSLWRHLPGRELFVSIYQAAGLALPWLPLAMSPARALNALMSLSVPLATLLLFAVQQPEERSNLWTFIWIAAVLSVLLGMLQLTGPPSGPLYLYRITNDGFPVGLFANRNHQALLVGIAIVLAGTLLARARLTDRSSMLFSTLVIGSMFLFVPFLLITGSRAGLLIGVAMMLPAALIIYISYSSRRAGRQRAVSSATIRAALAAGLVTIAGLFVAAVVFSRSLAFDRLVNSGSQTELRIDVLPSLLAMLQTHFGLGIGFGAFEFAYRRIEPTSLLMPSYLNQAHNDWMQLAIEGGLPAMLLLTVFIAWFVSASLGSLKSWRDRPDFNVFASIAVIVAFAAASLVDYPVRVPSMMVVFAIACAFISVRQSAE